MAGGVVRLCHPNSVLSSWEHVAKWGTCQAGNGSCQVWPASCCFRCAGLEDPSHGPGRGMEESMYDDEEDEEYDVSACLWQ